jgi:hypothetical protein
MGGSISGVKDWQKARLHLHSPDYELELPPPEGKYLASEPQGAAFPLTRHSVVSSFSRKVRSLSLGLVFGSCTGLFFAFGIAYVQHRYYFRIMLPGGMVGLIVGYATQKYGAPAQLRRT